MPLELPPHNVQKQREWLRITLTSIGDAVITTDTDARVTFLNPIAEKLTGWTDDDARGRPLEDVFRIINEDTRHQVESPASRALREGIVVGLANHTLLIARDGTERPIDDSAAPIRSDDNTVAGVVLVFRDVSERKRAEQALRDSQERFRLLVEGVSDYAIFMLDPGGHVASWNIGAERIKGWRADEIVGRHFSTFYPQQARDAGWPDTELRVAGAVGRFEDEGWRVRKDGSMFWANVIITALRGPNGELKGFSKITRDLSERRRAEAALRESETRYRRLFETAYDGILLIDTEDGCILDANPAAASLLGRPREALISVCLPDIQLFPDPLACEALLKRMRRQGQRMHQDVTAPRPDGSVAELELVCTSYAEAKPVLQMNLRDIRERRQLERTMLHAEAMADLNRRKDEFLAMLSHEMRNPLAPILNAVHLLQPRSDDTPEEVDARRIITRQVRRLAHMVDDLLEVSRITSGQFHLHLERLDLRVVVERAREAIVALMSERRHDLRVTLPDAPLWVHVDAARIEQVLVNLLTNAAKYTDPGGAITLTVEPVEGEAVLRVEDTGVGISPDMLPRVFDLFTQSERALDRAEGGLGVGLTVVQRVVELHGGRVSVASPGLGKGSTFTVRLPIASGPPASRDNGEAAAKSARSLRILVVDDNHDVADSTTLLLRHLAGHTVRTEYGGAEVRDAVREFRPDVVLLDLGLPGLDGYQVAAALREDPETASVHLVAVSGYGQQGDLARSREAGFAAHLVKPVHPKQLEDVLATLVTGTTPER
jgi:PAS domain S-box-containing protein